MKLANQITKIKQIIQNNLSFWDFGFARIEKVEYDKDRETITYYIIADKFHSYFMDDLSLVLHELGLITDYVVEPISDKVLVVKIGVRKPLEE
jgi:hypothetical protein